MGFRMRFSNLHGFGIKGGAAHRHMIGYFLDNQWPDHLLIFDPRQRDGREKSFGEINFDSPKMHASTDPKPGKERAFTVLSLDANTGVASSYD